MQLFNVRVINPRQFSPNGPDNGVFTFAEQSLPVGTSYLEGRVDRSDIETFADGFEVVRYIVDISRDNGATWWNIATLRATGGVLVDRGGNPITESTFGVWNLYLLSTANPADANTRIRGQMTVFAQTSTECWVVGYDTDNGT